MVFFLLAPSSTERKRKLNNINWESNLSLTTWTNHYDYKSTTQVVFLLGSAPLAGVSLVATLSKLTWCQHDGVNMMTTWLLPITSLETVTTEVFRQSFVTTFVTTYMSFVLSWAFFKYTSFFFISWMHVLKKRKPVKFDFSISLSLSLSCLSQFAVATICQPKKKKKKKKRRRKNEKSKEQKLTKEWVLHLDLPVCTVGTSMKIPVTLCLQQV